MHFLQMTALFHLNNDICRMRQNIVADLKLLALEPKTLALVTNALESNLASLVPGN